MVRFFFSQRNINTGIYKERLYTPILDNPIVVVVVVVSRVCNQKIERERERLSFFDFGGCNYYTSIIYIYILYIEMYQEFYQNSGVTPPLFWTDVSGILFH